MPTNDWEQLQSVYLRIQNRIVREDFSGVIADDDIVTPEGALRYACMLKDNDTADMTLLRLWLFYIVREHAKRLQAPMYAYPVDDYQEVRTFRPQILLEFWELQAEARRNNRDIVRRRASFRLMNETSSTVTESQISAIGNRIRTAFPTSYRFKTGRFKCSYRDVSNGIELIAQPYSQAEGKEFIGKVLQAANIPPDWDRFTVSQYPSRNFNTQQYQTILGKSVKLKKRRPIANTYLRRATLHLHGRTESVILYEDWIR